MQSEPKRALACTAPLYRLHSPDCAFARSMDASLRPACTCDERFVTAEQGDALVQAGKARCGEFRGRVEQPEPMAEAPELPLGTKAALGHLARRGAA